MADPTGVPYSQVKPLEGEIRAPTWRDTLSNLPATLLGVDYTTDDPRTILLKTLMTVGGGLAALPGTPAAMRGAPLTKVMQGGKPQRVFHGTPNVFQEFSAAAPNPNALYGPGLYFTENPAVASSYANAPGTIPTRLQALGRRLSGQGPTPKAPNVRPAYLDITKPFDFDAPVDPAVMGLLQKHFPQRIIEQVGSNADAYRALVALHGTPMAATNALRRFGYDGITHIGGKISGGEPHRVWIAFKPEQVVNPFQYDAQIRGAPGVLPPP